MSRSHRKDKYRTSGYDDFSDEGSSGGDSAREVQKWVESRIRDQYDDPPEDGRSYEYGRYTRGGEDEKGYQDDREDSPLSALESAHSEPVSERRGNRSQRRDSPRYITAGQDSPHSEDSAKYDRRYRKHSDESERRSAPKQRHRGNSVDSVTSTRSRSRRLSMAEGRKLRLEAERVEKEAKEREERERREKRNRRSKKNRERARRVGKRQTSKRVDNKLRKGDVVLVDKGVGVVRYIGGLHYDTSTDEDWIGVELKEPHGVCDGSVRGEYYFHCKHKHGIFVVEEGTKRLSPEDLLDQIAIQQHKFKEMKKEADSADCEEQENEELRNKIATMTHEICALKKNSVGAIASAVECKMEDFLNVLSDSLHPEDRSRKQKYGLPARSGEKQIINWLRRKKKDQNLSSKEDPRFVNENVKCALLWVVRTLQEEMQAKQRAGYADDSDGGSE